MVAGYDVEMEPLLFASKEREEIGEENNFELTRLNDNAVPRGEYFSVPQFNPSSFEDYDYCYVFDKNKDHSGWKLNPFRSDTLSSAEVTKLLMQVLRSRTGPTEDWDHPKSLPNYYQLSPDIFERSMSLQEMQNLILEIYMRTLQHLGAQVLITDSADGARTALRVRLTEEACRRISDWNGCPVQLDYNVTQYPEFLQDPDFIPPYLPYESLMETKSRNNKGALRSLGHVFQRYDRLSRTVNTAFPAENKELSLFRDTDRIRLLSHGVYEYLNTDVLMKAGFVRAAFPLAQPAHLEALSVSWGSFAYIYSWSQPLDQIRDYFGEEIAMYFAWMGFYCKCLVLPSILGTLLFICQNTFDSDFNFDTAWLDWLSVFYCIFMATWGSLFFQMWQRRQRMLSLRWGVEMVGGVKRPPVETPWFKHDGYTSDPIHPESRQKTFSKHKRISREALTFLFVVICTLVSIVFVNDDIASAILQRVGYDKEEGWMETAEQCFLSKLIAAVVGVRYVIPVLTSMLIKFLDLFWESVIVYKLSSFENHQWESSYRDSVCYKVFVYKFFNDFSVLFFLAFFKETFTPCDDMDDGRCILSCRRMLVSLFFVGISNNVSEILLPLISFLAKRCFASQKARGAILPAWEQQLCMTAYARKKGITGDWLDMMMQYGFLSLFSLIFPPLPLLAFIVSMIEIRSDAFKLCRAQQRPFPREASDIGAWETIQRGMTFAAVVNNIFLCAFVTLGYYHGLAWKLATSIILLLVALGAKEYIEYRVPEESTKYKVAKARMHAVHFEAIWGDRDRRLIQYDGGQDKETEE